MSSPLAPPSERLPNYRPEDTNERSLTEQLAERSALRVALRDLLNTHSVERYSGTPDFVLAEYLLSCLDAFHEATRQRERWHGRGTEEPEPCGFESGWGPCALSSGHDGPHQYEECQP